MNWYYESGGQQQGPVPEAELDRLVSSGTLSPDALVWKEGMAGWAPYRTVRTPPAAPAPGGGPTPMAPISPMASGVPGGESALPAASAAEGSPVPQPGWIQCTLTGRYFPPSEIIYLEGKPYSASAKPQVVASLQTGGMLPVNPSGRTGPAWEERQRLGIVKAAWETVKDVLLKPGECFSKMKREGGMNSPLLFLLLTGGVGMVIAQIYNFFLQGAMMSMAGLGGAQGGAAPPMAAMFGTTVVGMVVGMVLGPFILLVVTLVWAGIMHLCLMMLKGANQPYETTLRVTCYAYGATTLLQVVPVCGGIAGPIWALIALCIGLAKAHETSAEKGAGAVLIPFVVCCLGFVGLYVVAFGAIAAAAAGGGN
jgi:hypothetical protein